MFNRFLMLQIEVNEADDMKTNKQTRIGLATLLVWNTQVVRTRGLNRSM